MEIFRHGFGITARHKSVPQKCQSVTFWIAVGRFSRKLAVLAEVALALARNRQGAGPLETLKLSS